MKILHFYDCSAIQFYNSRRAVAVSKASTKEARECNGWNIRRNDKTRILNTFSAYIWIIIPLWFLSLLLFFSSFRVHAGAAFFLFSLENFACFCIKLMNMLHRHSLHFIQTESMSSLSKLVILLVTHRSTLHSYFPMAIGEARKSHEEKLNSTSGARSLNVLHESI